MLISFYTNREKLALEFGKSTPMAKKVQKPPIKATIIVSHPKPDDTEIGLVGTIVRPIPTITESIAVHW